LSTLELTEADDITPDSLIQRAFQPRPVNAAARARCSSVTRITFKVRGVHANCVGLLNLSTNAAEAASTTKLDYSLTKLSSASFLCAGLQCASNAYKPAFLAVPKVEI
jgi:hypothetical protein